MRKYIKKSKSFLYNGRKSFVHLLANQIIGLKKGPNIRKSIFEVAVKYKRPATIAYISERNLLNKTKSNSSNIKT